jgi:hypothetical protein
VQSLVSQVGVGRGANNSNPEKSIVTKPPELMEDPKTDTQGSSAGKEEEEEEEEEEVEEVI